MDTVRPVLILTRELVRPHLNRVTVAPITTTARGLSTEIPCGSANGLERAGVISCDNITTIATASLGRQIGHCWTPKRPNSRWRFVRPLTWSSACGWID
nr:type II toxin-antitoxin system PemK/MazF family toxin [Conexibacter sp. DBS9H8]